MRDVSHLFLARGAAENKQPHGDSRFSQCLCALYCLNEQANFQLLEWSEWDEVSPSGVLPTDTAGDAAALGADSDEGDVSR